MTLIKSLFFIQVGQEKMLRNVGIVKHDVRFYDNVDEVLQGNLAIDDQV